MRMLMAWILIGNLTITGGTTTVVGPTTVDNGSFDAMVR